MPIEAVKIPQNVYIEDRIIGPVTLKQLIISGLGLGMSYAIFSTAQKSGVTNPVALGVTWIPAVIFCAFAFMKVNDLTLFNIILLSIESFNKPNQRIWSPHAGLSINLITRQHVKEINDMTAKATTNADKLADITRQLEKRQEELSELAKHANPTPGAVEGVKTKLEAGEKHGLYEHEEVKTEVTPVKRERVQAAGLDKSKSIDSITDIVSAYESLTADPAH